MILTEIDHLPEVIQQRIFAMQRDYKKLLQTTETVNQVEEAIKLLPAKAKTHIYFNNCQEVQLIITLLETFKDANKFFGYLAKQGWKPQNNYENPELKQIDHIYLNKSKWLNIGLRLSDHAKCKYIKVGEKTVIQDIFEVRCDE